MSLKLDKLKEINLIILNKIKQIETQIFIENITASSLIKTNEIKNTI